MIKSIIFNTPMVKAVLQDRKTHTRRVIKPQPSPEEVLCQPEYYYPALTDKDGNQYHAKKQVFGTFTLDGEKSWKSPYAPGDILYVKETWQITDVIYDYYNGGWEAGYPLKPIPKTKPSFKHAIWYKADCEEPPFIPAIFMPRWAARIWLNVTDVRVQRVNDITIEDIISEGVSSRLIEHDACVDLRDKFANLWNSIYEKRGGGWETNPYVWVIEFERIEKPEFAGK